MSMESTSQKTSSRSAVSKDMELQVCVCGWSKATTVRGLKIHQGRMKCLREKGQGPRIDQYFLRSQSSQSNEIQRQEANHSSQDISTPVIDVRRTCMDTVSDEPNDPCEPGQTNQHKREKNLNGHKPGVKWPRACNRTLLKSYTHDPCFTWETLCCGDDDNEEDQEWSDNEFDSDYENPDDHSETYEAPEHENDDSYEPPPCEQENRNIAAALPISGAEYAGMGSVFCLTKPVGSLAILKDNCNYYKAASQHSSDILSIEGPLETESTMKMDMEGTDMTKWTEAEFEEKCTYIVNDYTWDPSTDGGNCVKAKASLPRNLMFKHAPNSKEVIGVLSREYIPKGTRFGPLVGEAYTVDTVPKNANRKYFWRIYSNGEFHHFIDGFNEEKSNWMRYVNPAHSQQEQNLAACQNGMNIYFYTVKPIPANQELLVWYCPEFAERLHYPPSGELMMMKLKQSLMDAKQHVTETDGFSQKGTGKKEHSVREILRMTSKEASEPQMIPTKSLEDSPKKPSSERLFFPLIHKDFNAITLRQTVAPRRLHL
ncbi:UNVERIFIED_CONTAM: hypothetical protein FKN15_063570 [Acipenser sinensis]